MAQKQLFQANLVYTTGPETLLTLPQAYVAVTDGRIESVSSALPPGFEKMTVRQFTGGFLIPPFTDLHVHAPQIANIGLGYDCELLQWLERYTFPEESRYQDLAYAKLQYRRFIHLLWQYGSLYSVVFATIHRPATELLMQLASQAGLAAYIGKVNMDRNSPAYLCESPAESFRETVAWLQDWQRDQARYGAVKPILTPRFVPSCTPELQRQLGRLARQYQLPVQSHLSENREEIAWVHALDPEAENYASVYDQAGLLGQTPTIMAHCIWNTEQELQLLRRRGVYVAHCPTSNNNLASGIAPVARYLREGLNMGLGSDLSGGHTPGMAEVQRQALQASRLYHTLLDPQSPSLSLTNVFYLATRGGGSFFGQVGSFEPGFSFDALWIDDAGLDAGPERSLEERLSRYIYCGDDRQIKERWRAGQLLPEPFKP
ncbi:MAG: amidohydrolase family protein [Oscillospiraceae bacterium]|nr:amidohydrolase family protein [Oscillospiraceae bacterium]MDD4368754.1 amidohydrolase family protein [Oscillospiraceae bacterium]